VYPDLICRLGTLPVPPPPASDSPPPLPSQPPLPHLCHSSMMLGGLWSYASGGPFGLMRTCTPQHTTARHSAAQSVRRRWHIAKHNTGCCRVTQTAHAHACVTAQCTARRTQVQQRTSMPDSTEHKYSSVPACQTVQNTSTAAYQHARQYRTQVQQRTSMPDSTDSFQLYCVQKGSFQSPPVYIPLFLPPPPSPNILPAPCHHPLPTLLGLMTKMALCLCQGAARPCAVSTAPVPSA
jgi:hypothetical protein